MHLFLGGNKLGATIVKGCFFSLGVEMVARELGVPLVTHVSETYNKPAWYPQKFGEKAGLPGMYFRGRFIPDSMEVIKTLIGAFPEAAKSFAERECLVPQDGELASSDSAAWKIMKALQQGPADKELAGFLLLPQRALIIKTS